MEHPIFPPSPGFAARARVTRADYERRYAESLRDPDAFWSREAMRLDWSGADGVKRHQQPTVQ